MIEWREAKDRPSMRTDATNVGAWHGKTEDGLNIYLTENVSKDASRRRFANLGVIGRMPTDDEVQQAIQKLGYKKANVFEPGGNSFGLQIEKIEDGNGSNGGENAA